VIADLLGDHPPYQAVRRLPGLGPVLAAVAVAEIGDVSRFFPGPGQLCGWATASTAMAHRRIGEPCSVMCRGRPFRQVAAGAQIDGQGAGTGWGKYDQAAFADGSGSLHGDQAEDRVLDELAPLERLGRVRAGRSS
jgi:hypothetical protein